MTDNGVCGVMNMNIDWLDSRKVFLGGVGVTSGWVSQHPSPREGPDPLWELLMFTKATEWET